MYKLNWRFQVIAQGQVNYSVEIDSIGYYSLHGSIMGCSLMVTREGVAGQECES